MTEMLLGQSSPRGLDPWGERMLAPDEVAAVVRLHKLGWGTKRIAGGLGCSRNTVKRYLAAGGWVAICPARRKRRLDGLDEWLAERFRRHRGNCDVVRQDLLREHGLTVSLRTVERAAVPLRQALQAEARACLRFETAPGKQLQIDFGGVPQEVLFDNARALVDHHDAATREVRFNDRLHAFAGHWRFHPRACAPYRARTKGKDERGVGYVKRNAIAGHVFISWAALEAHLDWWMREIADRRVHGTTGAAPLAGFQREEASALKALDGRPRFRQMRELVRRVQADCAVAVDANSYSVPWRLIGESVQVVVADGRVRILHAGQEVAVHAETTGRRQRIIDPAHFHGVAGVTRPVTGAAPALATLPEPALLRPLAEYERAAGGGWS